MVYVCTWYTYTRYTWSSYWCCICTPFFGNLYTWYTTVCGVPDMLVMHIIPVHVPVCVQVPCVITIRKRTEVSGRHLDEWKMYLPSSTKYIEKMTHCQLQVSGIIQTCTLHSVLSGIVCYEIMQRICLRQDPHKRDWSYHRVVLLLIVSYLVYYVAERSDKYMYIIAPAKPITPPYTSKKKLWPRKRNKTKGAGPYQPSTIYNI